MWQNHPLLGQLLETFVYQELRKQASWLEQPCHFYHFRDKDQVEVDILLEMGTALYGIEIKAAATVTAADFKGLNKLGEQLTAGVVFYDGEHILPFGEQRWAVPISALLARNTSPQAKSRAN